MAKYELPKLEYAYDALEPHIDAKTMEIHHTKHHQTYIDKLNAALDKHPELFEIDLKELLADGANSVPDDIKSAVINHGGGYINHCLFWEIMTPDKKKQVFAGKVAEAIKKKFGSFEQFKEQFNIFALNHFGSGWAWLVIDYNGELALMSTNNQDSPYMFSGRKPILGLDVWEHAYYLKFQNKRADYISSWWNVINWERVEELYSKVK